MGRAVFQLVLVISLILGSSSFRTPILAIGCSDLALKLAAAKASPTQLTAELDQIFFKKFYQARVALAYLLFSEPNISIWTEKILEKIDLASERNEDGRLSLKTVNKIRKTRKNFDQLFNIIQRTKAEGETSVSLPVFRQILDNLRSQMGRGTENLFLIAEQMRLDPSVADSTKENARQLIAEIHETTEALYARTQGVIGDATNRVVARMKGSSFASAYSGATIGFLKALEYFDLDRGMRFTTLLTRMTRQQASRNHQKETHWKVKTFISSNGSSDLENQSRGIEQTARAHPSNDPQFRYSDAAADPRYSEIDPSQLRSLLRILKPRQIKIIQLYYGLTGEAPMSFDEIGRRLRLTKQGASSSFNKSIKKLREIARIRKINPADFWTYFNPESATKEP